MADQLGARSATDDTERKSKTGEGIEQRGGVESDTSSITSRDNLIASTSESTTPQEDGCMSDTSKGALINRSPPSRATPYRYDVVLWLFGILFIGVLNCAIIGIGEARGWDAYSAYNHNESTNSQERFLPKPFVPEPGVYKRSDSEAASRWYYWKLKPELVHVGTKLFVWISYTLHILSVWLVLYLQQKSKTFLTNGAPRQKRYDTKPSKYNLILFAINAFFYLVHLVNTHITYDGLAGDTSEASSQSAMIVALVLIMFIEFSERGMIIGYPSRHQLRNHLKSIWMTPVYLIRKFHGYFIYWAATYTFWYHPMESTPGHVLGFAHTWFFVLQGSLAYTNAHLNKYWRMTIEVWVGIHAGIVAFQTVPNIMGKELWPMFFFGFTAAWVLTQFYGIPLWKDIPSWTRTIPVGIFVAFVITSYSFIKDVEGRAYVRLAEIIRIPGIYYMLLLVGWLLIVLLVKIGRLMRENRSQEQSIVSDSESTPRSPPPPVWKEVVVLTGVILTYVFSVLMSWLVEYIELPLNILVIAIILSYLYIIVSGIGGTLLLGLLIPVRNV